VCVSKHDVKQASEEGGDLIPNLGHHEGFSERSTLNKGDEVFKIKIFKMFPFYLSLKYKLI